MMYHVYLIINSQHDNRHLWLWWHYNCHFIMSSHNKEPVTTSSTQNTFAVIYNSRWTHGQCPANYIPITFYYKLYFSFFVPVSSCKI